MISQPVKEPYIVRNKYLISLSLFVIFSLLGQYGCTTKVSLEFFLGEGWWIPLCVITVVPLIDVSRSFTQHYGEKTNIRLKYNLSIMMCTSLVVSLVFVTQGVLPESVCIANFLAVNIGGAVDLLVFWLIGSISQKPYFRMAFSNLAATHDRRGCLFCYCIYKFSDTACFTATYKL